MTGTPDKDRGGRPWWPWIAVALGLGSVAFYAWVGLHHRGEKVEWWGQLAESIGLFSSFFNAGALLAALYTLHLQRQELERARRDALTDKIRAERGLLAQENLIVAQNLGAAIAAHSALATAYGDQLDRLDPHPDKDDERKRLGDLLNKHAVQIDKLTRATVKMARKVLSFHQIMRARDPARVALGLDDAPPPDSVSKALDADEEAEDSTGGKNA